MYNRIKALVEMGPAARAYRKAVTRGDWNDADEKYGEIPVKRSRMRARRDAQRIGQHGGGDKEEDAQEVKTTVAALKKGKPGSDTQKKALAAGEEREMRIRRRRDSRARQAASGGRGPGSTVIDDEPDRPADDDWYNPR